MKLFLRLEIIIVLLLTFTVNGQQTLPIYSDYLSDNVFLVHPSAAGIGNTGKLRFTVRQQWAGIRDAPSLQTMSFHNKFGRKAALGIVAFNDRNGFHSQKGIQGTYAYHLELDRGYYFNQLSFGIAFTGVQNQRDQSTFAGDPTVAQLIESSSYFNADFSVAYHYSGFSSYFTVKNLLLSAKSNLNNSLEPLDLRNYIFSFGYYFNNENSFVQLEPSIMVQLRESTGERTADFNIKAYKTYEDTQLWVVLSYRKSFDANPIENLQYITPIIGINHRKLMFSYTYTKQLNDIVLTNAGFHQFSLGINLFTRRQRATACPNINAAF
ncbi:MAG: type IX secretion system membrane protein PorP/SprF [Flavobacteriaceae bacterium]|nr:MAG: type IX secretion system membrane protein PorP/SprF [Flavobacteriaceae bacterium]